MSLPSRHRSVRGKIVAYLAPNFNIKVSLAYILVFVAIVVADSTIVKFFTYSGVELPTFLNFTIFIVFFVIFAVINITLLNSVKKNRSEGLLNLRISLKYSHKIIFSTQILTFGIIMLIILQMSVLNKYSKMLLQIETYVTHIAALIFLFQLVVLFAGWFKSKRNLLMLLYMISFALFVSCVLVSAIYLEFYFSRSLVTDIRAYPVHSYVITLSSTQSTQFLGTMFDVLSLSSFLAIWLSTITLLYFYRHKLGRIKFFTLITIPLIYYLFPLEAYFGNIFSPFILSSPITFGIAYVLIFSATRQVGALLFSLAFLTASTLVTKDKVRKSLLFSAIGMAILFGSIEITPLQYKIFPPFGLITQAFLPLGSYMLLIGIFTSATGVARDAQLRKEFYKSAKSQLNLLKTIGITQMESELLKEYNPVLARSKELEEPEYQPLEQSDVKEIIHDVLQELQARESHVSKNRTKKD
jgi:hypothetical protein